MAAERIFEGGGAAGVLGAGHPMTIGTDRRLAIVVKLIGLALVLLAVMWYRRPDQFSHPYIWIEDGTVNLPDYVAHGWSIVLRPIVGYISVPVRVLFAIAVSVSFRWFPEISFMLTLLFSYGVLVAIALAPTALRHKFLCAMFVLFVPTGSEVYGVSLVIGWWGSLLALLPLLWPVGANTQTRLRLLLLAIGGLSTPVSIGLLPLYGLRAYLWRQRSDWWLAMLCVGLSAVQGVVMWFNTVPLYGNATAAAAADIPTKFFGNYVYWSDRLPESGLYLVLGMTLIATITVASYLRRGTLDWTFVALAGPLVITIALCVVRAPANVMHPILAGGRYFFLPFILLSWLLLYLLDTRHQGTTVLCAAALLLSVRTAFMYGHWTHQAIDWRAHIEQCVEEPSHMFPVHYEGDRWHKIMWGVELTGDACQRLVSDSLFDNTLKD